MFMAELVRETARKFPNKIALCDGSQSYSFHEIDYLSENFAGFLMSAGVRVGDRIAFCSQKSATTIVAIMGCLKAGATYVPLDGRSPVDRLSYTLRDLAPRFLCSTRQKYDAIAVHCLGTVLIDEEAVPYIFQQSSLQKLLPSFSSSESAYCIYTSGSSGHPKGVVIRHASVGALYKALEEIMPVDFTSRCMNTSELSFDVHIMDIFYPLYRGATVYLSKSPISPSALLRTIEDKRITHFTAVAPMMTLMANDRTFPGRDLSSVSRVMTGAEVLNVTAIQTWLRKVPRLTVINGYGPTEATVICTSHVISHPEPDRSRPYPIGKGMIGVKLLLMNDGQPVSNCGVSGELLIGGTQLMKGYWNDDKRTEDKTCTIDGERYYRSGDICQWLPDGSLDYLGRTDHEVKIAGFRVDLSEIKRVMDSVRCVKDSCPIVAAHPALGKRIAACFMRNDEGPTDQELFTTVQAAFRCELPYYMVPSFYFLFDAFPKMTSGKVDVKRVIDAVNLRLTEDQTIETRFVVDEVDGRSRAKLDCEHGHTGKLVSS